MTGRGWPNTGSVIVQELVKAESSAVSAHVAPQKPAERCSAGYATGYVDSQCMARWIEAMRPTKLAELGGMPEHTIRSDAA